MVEVLQFIFQDFLHWIGTVILLMAPGGFVVIRNTMASRKSGNRE